MVQPRGRAGVMMYAYNTPQANGEVACDAGAWRRDGHRATAAQPHQHGCGRPAGCTAVPAGGSGGGWRARPWRGVDFRRPALVRSQQCTGGAHARASDRGVGVGTDDLAGGGRCRPVPRLWRVCGHVRTVQRGVVERVRHIPGVRQPSAQGNHGSVAWGTGAIRGRAAGGKGAKGGGVWNGMGKCRSSSMQFFKVATTEVFGASL